MRRIAGPGATQDNRFTEGNAASGLQPTMVTADWCNDVQEEIVSVIAGAGIALDGAKQDQLKEAILKIGFRGFAADGRHEPYTGDLSAIPRNSLYAFNKGTVTNAPTDMAAATFGFVHTMFSSDGAYRTQIVWSAEDTSHSGWWRRFSSNTWNDWREVGSSGEGLPVGAEMMFVGTAPPPGWLEENGAELPRAAYPDLWAHAQASGLLVTEAAWQAQSAVQSSVGVFSSGDGSTTFRLPKVRDFVRAADASGGRGPGVWQADAIRNITGTLQVGIPNAAMAIQTATGPFYGADAASANQNVSTTIHGSSSPHLGGFDASRSVPTANENRPKSVARLCCIKAFDVARNAAQVDMAAAVADIAQRVKCSDFTQNLAASGWTKLPNGLILQWGSVSVPGAFGTTAVTFPMAFPTACYGALITSIERGQQGSGVRNVSATGVTIVNGSDSGALTFQWMAYGK